MLGLIATIKVEPGKEEQFIAAFKNFVPNVKQEPGTLVYQLSQSQADPTTFIVYERYESKEALDAHGSSDKFKEFGRSLKGVTIGRPEITMYNPIV